MKKSPNDLKNYQAVTLDNGLRVLLVENKHSNKAAAALAVNVGHFSDPLDRQGMAHFLEHMLFLGTKTYPDGSEYQKFINQYGGSNNAWTATEHTCFFFDINYPHFDEALDRFSRFFSEPLLSKDFINSERQNIDAEFKLKLKDDLRRLYDVHKETVNPAHPFAKFSVGNSETLADQPDSDIQTELAQFFNRYYQAQFMTLVLESPLSLNEMHALASTHFGNIASSSETLTPISQPLYLPEHQQRFIEVKPVKNERQLIISFAMPSIDAFYRHKSESLLAHLLGHEGEGSILSLLKAKKFALAITAGSGVNGSNFKDFNLNISLTPQGEQHLDEITAICFAYIALIKSQLPLPNYYYQEKRAMAELAFEYYEKQKPIDSVCKLVINMHHYPAEDYIYGDYVMDGLCAETFNELLACLNPTNMRITHISQQSNYQQLSKWYHAPYNILDINSNQIERWFAVKPHQALALPQENNYIVTAPKVLELEQADTEQTSSLTQAPSSTIPQLIEQKDGVNIWFKQDNSFNVPKGYIYISIDSPFIIASITNIAMTRLFVDLYSNSVLEKNYHAELAGIHYHLYAHQGGMTLQLSGLSEKQPQLLADLLAQLTQAEFTLEQFNLFKQQLLVHWRNSENSKSISQLFACLSASLQPKNPSGACLAAALEHIEFKQFNQFCRQLFTQISIEALIHGNWQSSHAVKIAELIKSAFNQNYSEKYLVDIPCIDIDGQGPIIVPMHIAEHDHACVIYFPFADKSLKSLALAMITSQLLSPTFFQQMRTEKQYGYLVGVGFVPMNRYPGIAFYIQSPNTQATQLMQAIDVFIDECSAIITEMENDHWQQLQQGLAAQLKESDASLRIKSQRFWSAISNNDTHFDQKKQLTKVLLSLTKADIENFISAQLVSSSRPDKIALLSYQNEQEFNPQNFPHQKIYAPEDLAKINQRKY